MGLVARDEERARLEEALAAAALGDGALVLLAGEAGVGKTALAEALAAGCSGLVLRGAAQHASAAPYAPIVAVLRAYLHAVPGGLDRCGPLTAHLGLLVPELGPPPPGGDRATVFEAVRCALAEMASDRTILVLLDDLQWCDDVTLELLAALAGPLVELAMLVVATYRTDELPREHRLRWLRSELRRAGRLDEVRVEPLDAAGTRDLLDHALDDRASGGLARAVHDRTQGIPFFVQELAAALVAGGRIRPGRHGLELTESGELPVPATVRDAVLMRMAGVSAQARTAAEAAAVAGERFDLETVAPLAGESGLLELLEQGLLEEPEPGVAAFRHALAREAVYADVPWLRRRRLHAALADTLARQGGPSLQIATHRLGARDTDGARIALVAAAAEFAAVHAYRDAARAARRAIEEWPEEDIAGRLEVLERYAHCAELAGELAEAVRAWREVGELRAAAAPGRALADAERRLAGVYELQGDRERAIAARRVAAEAYAANDLPAEAAAERLVAGNFLRLSADHSGAVELALAAGREADAAGRVDLRARALGLEGLARTKRGEFERGLQTIRAGLSLALEHDLTAVAGELYQRLSVAIYDSADYRPAQEALETALTLCRATGERGGEIACVSCLAYVLRELGEWERGAALCRELIAADSATWVAQGLLGTMEAFRGRLRPARRLLVASLAVSTVVDHYNMRVDSTAALAFVAEAEGDDAGAAELHRTLLARWRRSEDHHYAIGALRAAAAYFATRGAEADARACAEALAAIAADTGHTEALAALAAALGEAALLDGDPEAAAEQLGRAVELHGALDLPYERAWVQLRAGAALAAAGEREPALELLRDSYRGARRLGARPLAMRAAAEVAALGESLELRLGRRAAAEHDGAGLTRRELEVVRLVAVGRTNREIAGELFLSTRTVDMHVRNILAKLDCRSRTEASGRARELGLLA